MTHTETITRYFHRQYETEEGSVEENIDDLFATGFVYHLGEQRMSRDNLIETANRMRSSAHDGRRVEVSDAKEEGDDVVFHLSMRMPGIGADGSALDMESDFRWHFDSAGKVSEAWALQGHEVAAAMREVGVDPTD